MDDKQKNGQVAKITVFVTSVFVIFLSISYAFITDTLTGEKSVVINAGVLDLVLEEENEITLSNALPMYDEVGMIQDEVFNFKLINNTENNTNYKLILNKISTSNELSTDIVKYYLTKDKVGTPKLLSTISSDNVVDEGTIEGNKTINYSLRLWIDSSVDNNDLISGKSLSYKVNIEAVQDIEDDSILLVDALDLENRVDTTTSIDFSNISSETNGRGIYKYTEDGEDIYYFRGAVTDNHIIFGGYCWEIVRTTKTGGVKIIYDGEPVDGKCTNTGVNSQIGTSVFNTSYNDNAYVGYMYGLTGLTSELSSAQCIKLSSTGTSAEVGRETDEASCKLAGGKWVTTAYEATHANVVNSNIKTTIDNWFSTSNLITSENLEKLEDAVYCNDRSIDMNAGSSNTTLGYGTNAASYNVSNRLYINKVPSLECVNVNDRFTVSESNGNGDLTYPVGLITADEIALAGGNSGSNNSDYYLYTGQYYWVSSPFLFYGTSAREFSVDSTGSLYNYFVVNNVQGIRPVVSLASGAKIAKGGDGTEANPYVVE